MKDTDELIIMADFTKKSHHQKVYLENMCLFRIRWLPECTVEQKSQSSKRKLEDTSSSSSSSLQYSVVLPDSRNPSLRKRFEPRFDYKPSSPDRDLTEVDELEIRTKTSRRDAVPGLTSSSGGNPHTSFIRYAMLDLRSGKKSMFA